MSDVVDEFGVVDVDAFEVADVTAVADVTEVVDGTEVPDATEAADVTEESDVVEKFGVTDAGLYCLEIRIPAATVALSLVSLLMVMDEEMYHPNLQQQ